MSRHSKGGSCQRVYNSERSYNENSHVPIHPRSIYYHAYSGESSNNYLENQLKNTEKERDDALKRIAELEKQIEDMVNYAPGGSGYQTAKEHFDNLVNSTEKLKD